MVEAERLGAIRDMGGIEAVREAAAWCLNCPACGYPGHGERNLSKKYMGIYSPGESCGKCGYREAGGIN